jgi:selenocysteine-specific translation elongation factor
MKNLAVGIFHDEELGRELGKKGTESDIAMFNRKTEQYIFTFLSPVVDKLATKSQIMSNIDAALLSIQKITPEVGETILMFDSFGISQGIVIVPPYIPYKRYITCIISYQRTGLFKHPRIFK